MRPTQMLTLAGAAFLWSAIPGAGSAHAAPRHPRAHAVLHHAHVHPAGPAHPHRLIAPVVTRPVIRRATIVRPLPAAVPVPVPVFVGAARPDLMVEGYRILGTRNDGGGWKTTLELTIRNIGSGAAGMTTATAGLDENPAATLEVAPLKPGESFKAILEVEGSAQPSSLITLMADALSMVAESDEANNLRREGVQG